MEAQLPPLPNELLTKSSLDTLISSVRSASIGSSTRTVLQQPRDAYLVVVGPRGGAAAALTHALVAAAVETYDDTIHLPCQRDELLGVHYTCIRFNRLGNVAPEDGSATGAQVINERHLHVWTCAGTAADASHVASSIRSVMKEGYLPPAASPNGPTPPASAPPATARASAPHTPARGSAASSELTPAPGTARRDAAPNDALPRDALSFALCHTAVYIALDGAVAPTLHLQLVKYTARARAIATHLLQGVPQFTLNILQHTRALDTRSFHAFRPPSSRTSTPGHTPGRSTSRPSNSYAPYRGITATAAAKAHAFLRSGGWPFPMTLVDSDDAPAPAPVSDAPSALVKCICIMRGQDHASPVARLMTSHIRTVAGAAGLAVLAITGGSPPRWKDSAPGTSPSSALVGSNPLPSLVQVAVNAGVSPAHSHVWASALAAAQSHISSSVTHAYDTAETGDASGRVWDFMPSSSRILAPLIHTLSASITPPAASHACTSGHSLILRVLVDTALCGAMVNADIAARHVYKRVHEFVHAVADAAVTASHAFTDTMTKRAADAAAPVAAAAVGGILPAGLSSAPAAPVQVVDVKTIAPRVALPSGETLARFKSDLSLELACALALHIVDTALRPLLPSNGQPFPPSLARAVSGGAAPPVSLALCIAAGYDSPAILADETAAAVRALGGAEGDASPLTAMRTHELLMAHAAQVLDGHTATLIDEAMPLRPVVSLHGGAGDAMALRVIDVAEEHPLAYLNEAGLHCPPGPASASLLTAEEGRDTPLSLALRMDAAQLLHALVTGDEAGVTWASLLTRVVEAVDTPTRVADSDDDLHTFLRVYDAEVRDGVAAARAAADAIVSRSVPDSPAASMDAAASRVSAAVPLPVTATPAPVSTAAAAATGDASRKDAKAFFAGLKARGATTRSAAAAAAAADAKGGGKG